MIFHNFEPFPKYKGIGIDFIDILQNGLLIYFLLTLIDIRGSNK